jgi:hypothetical protein
MRHSISDKSLQRFTKGTSSREEGCSIVAHLLRGCASCAAKMRSTLQPEIPADAYDSVFDRLSQKLRSAAGAPQAPQADILHFKRPAVAPAAAVPHARRARR